jgi:ACT domain-containing protein
VEIPGTNDLNLHNILIKLPNQSLQTVQIKKTTNKRKFRNIQRGVSQQALSPSTFPKTNTQI